MAYTQSQGTTKSCNYWNLESSGQQTQSTEWQTVTCDPQFADLWPTVYAP